ncbi:MAG: hypothetical protein QXP68_04165 [Thermosphaera sp.]
MTKELKEVYERAFKEGVESLKRLINDFGPFEVLGIEEFTVPCSKCGKPMIFSSRFREEWEKNVRPILKRAFANWCHVRCE